MYRRSRKRHIPGIADVVAQIAISSAIASIDIADPGCILIAEEMYTALVADHEMHRIRICRT